ncbi:MAG: PLP-dependent aminotransferase family protein [Chloroflexota bacterium]|nr:PLP-dependent aminotransferase family protein [Chloroflexota bacterium]MDE2961585.1 PLP-dependent aminotransferase family protein [Chloroflexota bacterium]
MSEFNYEGLFAERAPITTRGANRHARYDFAVAYPDPDTLPLTGLVDALSVALEREGRDLAYYPVSAGYPPLRELVADKLRRDRQMEVTADDIVLTSGSGEAINMLIQAMTDPGDVLLTEEYVYLGTMRQMRLWSANVVGVKCDDDGIIPEALDETIRAQHAAGRRVKFLYTIPTFQNPLGWTATLERRQRMLEVCQSHGVPILEDDCYVDLRFEGEDVTSISSLDDSGSVLYVGSMSKIIAPGVRMGYLVAPEIVRERALSFKSGGVNQFAALAIEEYLRNHMYDHIDEENQALRAKRDAMLAALGEHFGNRATWSKPEGGLYLWLTMPEGTDLAAFQEQSFNEGVGYYNGAMFSPEGNGTNMARLCFGHPTAQTVSDGIAELAAIFERNGIFAG